MSQIVKTNKEVSVFSEYNREQLELIKEQIAKGSTDQELLLFLTICKQKGLDPLGKQVWFIKYKPNSAPIMTASIDGLRLIAIRSGEYNGSNGAYWCGEDGVWKDVWVSSKPPVAAKFVCYRKGCDHPFTGVALFKEYNNPNPSSIWKNIPTHMLAKVAESMALRKAFPAELSGLYEQSEIRDLEVVDTQVVESKPKQPVQQKPVQQQQCDSRDTYFDPKNKTHIDSMVRVITDYEVDPTTMLPEDKVELVKKLSLAPITKSKDIIEAFLKEKYNESFKIPESLKEFANKSESIRIVDIEADDESTDNDANEAV